MALTNAQKQARWRERHIERRRTAQRLANLLMRKYVSHGQIEDVAAILYSFFNREDLRTLRRELRRLGEKPNYDQYISASFAAEYAAAQNEREDWEREHPGQEYPELECSLSDREYTDLARWRRQRGRKHARGGGDTTSA
jgi:hypothetical protein